MRNYQRKRNNPYLLPDALYRRMLYTVRDYERLKCEWENILHETLSPDGQPTGTAKSDPTAVKAIRREKLLEQIKAVDEGVLSIPAEYRRGVLAHIKYGDRFPDYADRKTWFVYQSRFLYHVAKKLGEI